jgi:hypothetical protein
MDFLLWLCLPAAVAGGSAFLTYPLMRDKLTIAVERERQSAREVRVLLEAQKESMETRIAAAEERARRVWMEDLIAGRTPGLPGLTFRTEPQLLEPRLLE